MKENKKLLKNRVAFVLSYLFFSEVIIYVGMTIMYALGKEYNSMSWPNVFVRYSGRFSTMFVLFLLTSALFASLYYLFIVKPKRCGGNEQVTKTKHPELKAFVFAGIIPFMLFIVEYKAVSFFMILINNSIV